ncbi:Uncharacterised protein [Acinetobacter baumannii]|nr:Uncharacterised protein [Acinetobacter baumannii]
MDQATLVGQRTGHVEREFLAGVQVAIHVAQVARAAGHARIALGAQQAIAVVQLGGQHLQLAGAALHDGASAVVQCPGSVHGKVAASIEPATGVDDLRAGYACTGARCQRTAAVVEATGNGHVRLAVADDQACSAVVQRAGLDLQHTRARMLDAATLVQQLRSLQVDTAGIGGDAPAGVAQGTCQAKFKGIGAGLQQFAGAVVQRGRQQADARALQAARIAQQVGGTQVEQTDGGQAAADIAPLTAARLRQQGATGPDLATLQQQAVAQQVNLLAGVDLAGVAQLLTRIKGDAAGAADLAVGQQARHDHAAVVDLPRPQFDVTRGQHAPAIAGLGGLQRERARLNVGRSAQCLRSLQRQRAAGEQRRLVVQVAIAAHLQISGAVDRSLQRHAGIGGQHDALLRKDLARLLQAAARVRGQCAGRQRAPAQHQGLVTAELHVAALAAQFTLAAQGPAPHLQRLAGHQAALVVQRIAHGDIDIAGAIEVATVVDHIGLGRQCSLGEHVAGVVQRHRIQLQRLRTGQVAAGAVVQRVGAHVKRAIAGDHAGIVQCGGAQL